MNSEQQSQPKRSNRTLRHARNISVALLLVLLVVRITGVAEQLAYWPTRDPFTTPTNYEDLWITTPDGVRLHAWFMPARGVPADETAPAVLHVHGNAGNISYHDSFSSFLTDHGIHVLLFDYRCYGRSDETGPLNPGKLSIDTTAALDALMNHPRVDPDRVGILGVSLGGAFAVHAATNEPRVRAIATLSAFSSWLAVASDFSVIAPLILPDVKSAFNPAEAVGSLGNQPYLIMHGRQDAIVDARHAQIIHDAAQNEGVEAKLALFDGDHNTLVQTNRDAREQLIEFFKANLSQ